MTAISKSKIVIRRGAAYDDITIHQAGKKPMVLDRAAAHAYDRQHKTRVERDMIESVADIYVAEHGLNKDARTEKRARDQKFKKRRNHDEG